MIRFLRRLFLRHKLASTAANLELIERERANLELSQKHYLAESQRLRLELLNFDIRARHARIHR